MKKFDDMTQEEKKRLGQLANFLMVRSVVCGNCGAYREVGVDFIVEKCPKCGDDEYDESENMDDYFIA